MGAISKLFNNIGLSFHDIFTSPQALYGLYFIAFFFGMFSLYRVLINKIPHLTGKPANVIAAMVTVISVGGIFYGKNYDELIKLFNGFTGFLLLFLAIGILALLIYYGKNKEGALKWLIMSFGIYISTSILVEPFKAFWVGNTPGGAAGVIFSTLETISEISLIVFIISLIIFIIKLFNFDALTSKPQTEEQKNRGEMKKMLQAIRQDTSEAENYLKELNANLKRMQGAH